MADSNITKRALAAALKELMEEFPFIKISVADICAKCDINRKTFYYHFKDKYDLVNWIYDTEFMEAIRRKSYTSGWEFLEDLCDYLYANKTFYRRVLKVKGQNSFSEHFRELLLLSLQALGMTFWWDKTKRTFMLIFLRMPIAARLSAGSWKRTVLTPKNFSRYSNPVLSIHPLRLSRILIRRRELEHFCDTGS